MYFYPLLVDNSKLCSRRSRITIVRLSSFSLFPFPINRDVSSRLSQKSTTNNHHCISAPLWNLRPKTYRPMTWPTSIFCDRDPLGLFSWKLTSVSTNTQPNPKIITQTNHEGKALPFTVIPFALTTANCFHKNIYTFGIKMFADYHQNSPAWDAQLHPWSCIKRNSRKALIEILHVLPSARGVRMCFSSGPAQGKRWCAFQERRITLGKIASDSSTIEWVSMRLSLKWLCNQISLLCGFQTERNRKSCQLSNALNGVCLRCVWSIPLKLKSELICLPTPPNERWAAAKKGTEIWMGNRGSDFFIFQDN